MRKELFILLLVQEILQCSQEETMNYLPPRQYTPPEVADFYGYAMQSHEVETQDGYVLTLHRIPHGRRNDDSTYRVPALFCHGISSNSIIWLLYGTQRSLGFVLAEEGYDVWLINFRGTVYSQKHKYLSRDTDNFWDFSFHENAIYDVPAAIDYIQDVKKKENPVLLEDPKILFIGHSMGSTIFYALLSERPEYNNKLFAGFTLGPITFSSHAKGPVNRKLALQLNSSGLLTENMIGEYRPDLQNQFPESALCPVPIFRKLCYLYYSMNSGYNMDFADLDNLMLLFANVHDSMSLKQNLHFGQLMLSGKFCQYDYGDLNPKYYGQEKPFDYILSNINTTTYIFYSDGDWAADKTDVLTLANKLQEVTLYKVPHPAFSHIDFLYCNETPTYVNKRLVELASKYKVQTRTIHSSEHNWLLTYLLALLVCILLHKYYK